MATLVVSALAFVVSASSSIESAVLSKSSVSYRVSEVVASLFTALFLLRFAARSLVLGPLLKPWAEMLSMQFPQRSS
jgi:hypothetical protein